MAFVNGFPPGVVAWYPYRAMPEKGGNDNDKRKRKGMQMALAKDALALLMLHEELDVRLHRECIELIGEAWDIPAEEQREPLALLEEE